MTLNLKGNPPSIPFCPKCGCILPKNWKESFCSVECFAGDDPDDCFYKGEVDSS